MRRQPGRSPEEGTSLSTAYARRRPVPGRRRGRGRRRGSLFAASAGSSAVPPPSSPPPSPPSSDGSRTSGTGGTANAPAGVHLSGLVSVGTGHLRLNNLNPRWTSRQAVSRLNESSPGSGATAVHFSNVSSVPSPRIKRLFLTIFHHVEKLESWTPSSVVSRFARNCFLSVRLERNVCDSPCGQREPCVQEETKGRAWK